jgi:hypothetical protein
MGVAIASGGSLVGVKKVEEGFWIFAMVNRGCKGQIPVASNALLIFFGVKLLLQASLNIGQKRRLVIDIQPSPP